jgi:hypothetical protein
MTGIIWSLSGLTTIRIWMKPWRWRGERVSSAQTYIPAMRWRGRFLSEGNLKKQRLRLMRLRGLAHATRGFFITPG